jgi:hypothetical protein
MTQLLQQALDAVQQLAPKEQDAIAAIILEELADDRRWDEAFARSEDRLAQLAQKVRGDIERTLPPGEGIRRSAGAWADDPQGLDDYLKQLREQREQDRPLIEP